jgi:hypothetical protein
VRVRPRHGFQNEVDEPGTRHAGRRDQIVGAQPLRNSIGKIPRFCLGFFGEHHGGVRSHVAMRRILGRFYHHARQIGGAAEFQRARRAHARQHIGKKMLSRWFAGHGRRHITL